MSKIYFRDSRDVYGPIELEDFEDMIFEGKIALDVMVSRSTEGPWKLQSVKSAEAAEKSKNTAIYARFAFFLISIIFVNTAGFAVLRARLPTSQATSSQEHEQEAPHEEVELVADRGQQDKPEIAVNESEISAEDLAAAADVWEAALTEALADEQRFKQFGKTKDVAVFALEAGARSADWFRRSLETGSVMPIDEFMNSFIESSIITCNAAWTVKMTAAEQETMTFRIEYTIEDVTRMWPSEKDWPNMNEIRRALIGYSESHEISIPIQRGEGGIRINPKQAEAVLDLNSHRNGTRLEFPALNAYSDDLEHIERIEAEREDDIKKFKIYMCLRLCEKIGIPNDRFLTRVDRTKLFAP